MMVLFCMMCRPPLATNELRSSTIGIASSVKEIQRIGASQYWQKGHVHHVNLKFECATSAL